METTFITIHDLTQHANILYSSDSIVDILGHTPDDVVGKSTWEFFKPENVPIAQKIHTRGVQLDKAAVLAYCEIKDSEQRWINCECCFTIVYNVMVCCTSVYRIGIASQKRAAEAPIVRRLFSQSPKDPRYHMLTHLSHKFKQDLHAQNPSERHEPRAALFLNRFTRTLTIMYATSGIEKIVGIPSDQMKGRSFYYCIQENCLEDAVRCLELAKGNDSIAYLRFWYRDPRQDDTQVEPSTSASEPDTDEEMTDISASEADTDRGTPVPITPVGQSSSRDASGSGSGGISGSDMASDVHARSSMGSQTSRQRQASQHPSQSAASSPENGQDFPIELEAVVSCTSDGLVVCLRKARPIMPASAQPQIPNPGDTQGVFAAPWAADPLFVPALQGQQTYPDGNSYLGQAAAAQGHGGPAQQAFMASIREQAIFAWALTGINGSLEQYARGVPKGESQPPDVQIWAPDGSHGTFPDNVTPGGSSGYGSGSGNGAGAKA